MYNAGESKNFMFVEENDLLYICHKEDFHLGVHDSACAHVWPDSFVKGMITFSHDGDMPSHLTVSELKEIVDYLERNVQ